MQASSREDEPRRSRRSKINSAKVAALDKIRQAKSGIRPEYKPKEVEDVYELVDDDEYGDIVTRRREEDFVIDDDGTGYADDGREIFDDDLEQPMQAAKRAKLDEKKKKKSNVQRMTTQPKNIKSMLLTVGPKKQAKEESLSLGDDGILDDILNDLNHTPVPLPGKRKNKGLKSHGLKKSTPLHTPLVSQQRAYSPLYQQKPEDLPEDTTCSTPKQSANFRESSSKRIEFFQSKSESRGAVKHGSDDMQRRDDIDRLEKESEGHMDNEVTDMDISDMQADIEGSGWDDLNDDNFVNPNIHQEAAISHSTATSGQKVREPVVVLDLLDSVGWETVRDQLSSSKQELVTAPDIDTSSLPLQDIDGSEVLQFYWLDAHEEAKQPGTVYLFGKVWIESAKTHVSCCVVVQNIPRQMYFLPREKASACYLCVDADIQFGILQVLNSLGKATDEDVSIMDVYKEFDEKVASRFKIMKFTSKRVSKNYCFDVPGVPKFSEYLEVKYSADYPPLPSDMSGNTFCHVFGTNTSSLELLIIQQRLKGPSWLHIKNPRPLSQSISWCKVEVELDKPDLIEVAPKQEPPPPLVVMSIAMKTILNSKTHTHEIVAIGSLINSAVHIDKAAPKHHFQSHVACVRKLNDQLFPHDFTSQVKNYHTKIEVTSSERAMLAFFVAKIHKIDPDLIIGHDMVGFELDVLLHRLAHEKVPHWSRVGRLRRSIMPRLSGPGGFGVSTGERIAMAGRMMCDVKLSSKELIRCSSYDLTALTQVVLKRKRVAIDNEDLQKMFGQSPDLLKLLDHTLNDASLCYGIMFELNVLPLAVQITNICGNILTRTLLGGRSERNEFLLLHAFHEKNYICPDKSWSANKTSAPADPVDPNDDTIKTGSKKGKRKSKYTGGLVLEPKKGLYDRFILLLDFNSLYPSIIQEYNICFTTIDRSKHSYSTNDLGEDEEMLVDLPDSSVDQGVLPTQIRALVERRREVKKLMKSVDRDDEQYLQFNIRQQALKLTANSMYGCLGFSHSRFYAKPLAALVTGKGREILLKTKDLAQTLNLEVIYGDTDSIMINTNCTDLQQVYQIGQRIQAEVNKLYRQVEIGIDGIFRSMLLLKKKKYAAVVLQVNSDGSTSHVKEMKGLDIVRRDWCGLAKDAGEYVIGEILSVQSRDIIVENIHTRLRDIKQNVENDQVPLEKFVITKSLTKNPDDYPDKNSLPHVQVAVRLKSKGRHFRSGDTVPYIICLDGSNQSATLRGYHPDELRRSDTLKIDYNYYLQQQVHPVVSRLCDPISGTDGALIADCLGLDSSSYQHSYNNDDEGTDALLGSTTQMTMEEKFKDAARLVLTCTADNCGATAEYEGVVKGSSFVCGLVCPVCTAQYSTPAIRNRLTLLMREHITRYYQGWMVSEDHLLETRTRRVELHKPRGSMKQEYSESALYTQLRYYQYLFDYNEALSEDANKHGKMRAIRGFKDDFNAIHATITEQLKQSGFAMVNLKKLFEGLKTSR
ncbi:DNA polymerase alpha catalytic subunit-like isoform X2 [Corticium candelabrum]|uniref:DNA polymerase alpha catalytic subunit-like isoform X2 n=1 Tax=Corticium candelabrum TaxID=121492 RepID=UPI002E2590AB|nr:DNA polymerase alpha catalytic subunit-like isoform X2 [Corticium candelabrum]